MQHRTKKPNRQAQQNRDDNKNGSFGSGKREELSKKIHA
jgi:hypothetical protein